MRRSLSEDHQRKYFLYEMYTFLTFPNIYSIKRNKQNKKVINRQFLETNTQKCKHGHLKKLFYGWRNGLGHSCTVQDCKLKCTYGQMFELHCTADWHQHGLSMANNSKKHFKITCLHPLFEGHGENTEIV